MSQHAQPAIGCGICPKSASFLCGICTNMPYCSPMCQKADQASHAPLCTTLSLVNEQNRPSPVHFRCIFFPVDETAPRFICLNYNGLPDQRNIYREDLKCYVSGSPSGGDAAFDDYIEANRNLANRTIIQHDNNFLGNGQPQNQCVKTLLGEEVSERWRGPLLAHSYKGRVEKPAYQTLIDRATRGKLIPLDMDTTSLPPILSFLNWRATHAEEYELGAVLDTKNLKPKKKTPKKKAPKRETPRGETPSRVSPRSPRKQKERSAMEVVVEKEEFS